MLTDDITPAEACAMLSIDETQAERLMLGPFALSESGLLDLRQVLGIRVLLTLPMGGTNAVHIAVTACAGASTDRPPQLLGVGWKHPEKEPFGCWMAGGVPADIRQVLLIVPVDRMMQHLTERLEQHRDAARLPN
jgi:hypothetical protein